jgi:hypothetical protein
MLSSREQSNIIPLISAESLGYVWTAMKLLDRVRDVGLRRHLARSTIACYRSWITEFLRFSRSEGRWRMPGELRAAGVERFLTHLARDRRVSASTQNQRCALSCFSTSRFWSRNWARTIWGASTRSERDDQRACRRCHSSATYTGTSENFRKLPIWARSSQLRGAVETECERGEA